MYVRQHLEFASPWLDGDIGTLENVQTHFFRMVSGLHGTSYGDRLNELGGYPLS